MKVLFLSTQLRPGRSNSAYTYRLDRLKCALEAEGVQTEFLGLREQPFSRPTLAQPLNLPFIRNGLLDWDFIHAGADAAYVAALWKRFTNAQVIHDVHGDTLGEAQLNWSACRSPSHLHQLLQAHVTSAVTCRGADRFLAVSHLMKDWLMFDGKISESQIGIVRNGVDENLFAPNYNGSRTRRSKEFVVGYAGGFDHWQGIENLVEAFELIRDRRVRLQIIGFADRHAELKAQIARRLGEKVDLVDRVPRKELGQRLSAAQFLIIPRVFHRAITVALPTKFAEYLALGKPVITCDVDETAHLVQQHECGLVSKPNHTDLAATIQSAAEFTETDLKRMGENGRHLVEREFSWGVIGRRYFRFLETWAQVS